jgi:hypothetical protein
MGNPKLLQLGSNLINVDNITYIEPKGAGVIIHFVGGSTLEVSILLDTLKMQIANLR